MSLSNVRLASVIDRLEDGYNFLSSTIRQSFDDKYPSTLTDEQVFDRHSRFRYLFEILQSTAVPQDEGPFPDSVPTTIEIKGPGSYGKTEKDEDGNDILMLDDDVLTSVANATIVTIDGNETERISVLYQVPQFLEHCPDECVNIMIPRMCGESVKWGPESQMAVSEALFFVVRKKLPHHIARQIAWASLSIAGTTNDEEVFDACSEITSTIMPQVDRYDVLDLVVPDAIDRAMSKSIHDRRLAATLIGSVTEALSPKELQFLFSKTAMSLTYDKDNLTRATMAQSMAHFAAKLPRNITEKEVWPRLASLADQGNSHDCVEAVRALAKSSSELREHAKTSSAFSEILRPLFLDSCKKASNISSSDLRSIPDESYEWLEVFAEIYGPFLYGVSPLMTDQAVYSEALNAFRLMATCNGPSVRHWCAFNLPGVSLVCSEGFSTLLSGIISGLAQDGDTDVRITLAKGMRETTKCLYRSPLRDELLVAVSSLVRDENAEARMTCLNHFSELFVMLSPQKPAIIRATSDGSGRPPSDESIQEAKEKADEVNRVYEAEMQKLDPVITSLEKLSYDTWRTQNLLLEQVRITAPLIMQQMLCDHIAPLLFQMARESSATVRRSAMRALMHVLRYIPDIRRRNHIIKHFKTEWAQGRVYWTRVAFIEAADCAREVFSTKFLTETFFEELLGMKSDAVVNVRIRLIHFLRGVARIWKEKKEYRQALERLCLDIDVEVRRSAQELCEQLDDVKPMTSEEIEADKRLEEAEVAFYVQKPRRKKKKKAQVPPSEIQNSTSANLGAFQTETLAAQSWGPHADEIAPVEREQVSDEPNSPRNLLHENSRASRGSGSPRSIISLKEFAKRVSGGIRSLKSRRSSRTSLKDRGEGSPKFESEESPQTQENEAANAPQVRKRLLRKLFSSCFGRK